MTKLDELINELCPDGVEYKTIGEITKTISMGLNPRQNFKLNTEDAKKYYVTVKEFTTGQIKFTEKTDKINDVAYELIQKRSNLAQDDILLSGIGTIGKVAIVDIPIDNFNCSESVYLIKLKVDCIEPRFFMHLLRTDKIQSFFYSNARGSTLKGIRMQDLKSLQIPVPPLPVQEEIVRILDKFTSYGDCLNKELSLRKKQYEWMRQKLLEIKGISVVQIKDVCRIEKGKTPIQKAVPGEYPLVVTTDERKTCNTYQFNCMAVCLSLVSARGHGVAQISRIFYQEGKFALGNILCAIVPNDKNQLSAKFLQHYLFYKKDSLLVPLMKGGANVALHISDLEKVKFPLPPLSVQQRIVNVLDNFDAICSDLKIGLPAEIDARKKQYEYYRDLLLTFAERGNTIFTEQNRTEQNRTEQNRTEQNR